MVYQWGGPADVDVTFTLETAHQHDGTLLSLMEQRGGPWFPCYQAQWPNPQAEEPWARFCPPSLLHYYSPDFGVGSPYMDEPGERARVWYYKLLADPKEQSPDTRHVVRVAALWRPDEASDGKRWRVEQVDFGSDYTFEWDGRYAQIGGKLFFRGLSNVVPDIPDSMTLRYDGQGQVESVAASWHASSEREEKISRLRQPERWQAFWGQCASVVEPDWGADRRQEPQAPVVVVRRRGLPQLTLPAAPSELQQDLSVE